MTTALPSTRTTPEATDLHALLAAMVASGVRAVVIGAVALVRTGSPGLV